MGAAIYICFSLIQLLQAEQIHKMTNVFSQNEKTIIIINIGRVRLGHSISMKNFPIPLSDFITELVGLFRNGKKVITDELGLYFHRVNFDTFLKMVIKY